MCNYEVISGYKEDEFERYEITDQIRKQYSMYLRKDMSQISILKKEGMVFCEFQLASIRKGKYQNDISVEVYSDQSLSEEHIHRINLNPVGEGSDYFDPGFSIQELANKFVNMAQELVKTIVPGIFISNSPGDMICDENQYTRKGSLETFGQEDQLGISKTSGTEDELKKSYFEKICLTDYMKQYYGYCLKPNLSSVAVVKKNGLVFYELSFNESDFSGEYIYRSEIFFMGHGKGSYFSPDIKIEYIAFQFECLSGESKLKVAPKMFDVKLLDDNFYKTGFFLYQPDKYR